ncbi:unnamed protein product [Pylaiella littoralis]
MTDRGGPETAHGVVVDLSYRAQTTASELAPSDPPLLPTAAQERQEEEGGEEASAGVGAGYVARLKAAVLDGVNTAKRAPETFEEALAVIKGERAVKPDYGRAVSTVTAAFAGGCVHGWWHGAALAAKYPPHQRSVVKFRAGAGRGVRFAAFALIFEGSSAAMEALRRKKDFVGGTVGGALAGMAYGVPGGVASARRGLFYGVWLGGLFSMFRNHVASLKEQAQLAEEHERLAQVFAASCESSGQQQMAFPTLNIIFRQGISCRYRSPLLLVHTLACVLIIV